jgi:hypothetical protein
MEKKMNLYWILCGNMKKKHSEDLGVDGGIIFKEDPRDLELQGGD